MKKAVSIFLVVLLCLAFICGCGKKDTLQKVVINEVTRSVFYAPMYVAISKGFFAEEGMGVSIETGGGSDKSMTALLANQADVALVGP